ncbi:MAG: 4Fe-4S binding protein, partial [Luteimonas sp.]
VEPLCTGCELCVPACPVDCIVLLESGQSGISIPPSSSNDFSAASSGP